MPAGGNGRAAAAAAAMRGRDAEMAVLRRVRMGHGRAAAAGRCADGRRADGRQRWGWAAAAGRSADGMWRWQCCGASGWGTDGRQRRGDERTGGMRTDGSGGDGRQRRQRRADGRDAGGPVYKTCAAYYNGYAARTMRAGDGRPVMGRRGGVSAGDARPARFGVRPAQRRKRGTGAIEREHGAKARNRMRGSQSAAPEQQGKPLRPVQRRERAKTDARKPKRGAGQSNGNTERKRWNGNTKSNQRRSSAPGRARRRAWRCAAGGCTT